jgi:hypothetical protein
MSTDHADLGHGHSPAAWTSVTIMLIAFVIGTVAFFLDLQWLVWASAALLVVGAVVGWALARAGYGVGGSKVSEKAH